MPTSDQIAATVTQIFQALFNRAPAASGLAFWTNAVLSGSVTMDQLPVQIALDASPADKATFTASNPSIAAQVYASAPGPIVSASATTTLSPTMLVGIAVLGYLIMKKG